MLVALLTNGRLDYNFYQQLSRIGVALLANVILGPTILPVTRQNMLVNLLANIRLGLDINHQLGIISYEDSLTNVRLG